MSKPICIHAWLARDNGQVKDTYLYLAKPGLVTVPDGGDYWTPRINTALVMGHYGLRPRQIKRVVITAAE